MKTESLGKMNIHVDNGGLSVEVKKNYHDDGEFAGAELEFKNEFFGYCTNTMTLHVGHGGKDLGEKELRDLANFFYNMANKFNK